MTGTVESTSSAGSTAAITAAQSRQKLAGDFDAFLMMLTTQLKNQDPLSPMDSNEFTSQLVQFASVEQQISANANLETMIRYQEAATMASATDYLDKTVGYEGNGLPLQDGEAKFSYTLEGEAKSVTITIYDAAGKVVRTMTGETASGTHNVTWDGKDDAGNQLADGAYKFEVAAFDSAKNAVGTTTTAMGKVTDIVPYEGNIVLSVGGVFVKLESVYTVKANGGSASSSTSSSSGSSGSSSTSSSGSSSSSSSSTSSSTDNSTGSSTSTGDNSQQPMT